MASGGLFEAGVTVIAATIRNDEERR